MTASSVCIVGATGFIGRNLVTALLSQPSPPALRVVVRPGSADPFGAQTGLELRRCGLDDAVRLAEAVAGSEVVYHLVSGSIPSTSNADPLNDVDVNLNGSIRLLEACRQAGVQRVVFVSSGGTVYGRLQQSPVAEDHPTFPICSYGIVKLAIERYLHLYHELHGLDYTVLRASNPYGPFQSASGQQGAVPVFIGKLLRGEPIEIWGDGSVVRDFLYIGDLVRALQQAGRIPRGACGIFNVGSGIGTSLNDLLDTLSRVSGLRDRRSYRPARAYDVPVSVLDISRIERALGWRPEVGLEAGLRATLEWFSLEQAQAARHPSMKEKP